MSNDANEHPQQLPMDRPLALRKGFRLQYEPAQECDVLLFPEGMITLSESAGAIMKYCDGSKDAEHIVAALQEAFPDADLRDDVLEFLATAWKNSWLSAA